MYTLSGATLDAMKVAFRRDSAPWLALMNNRVRRSFALDSLKKCNYIIIISTDKNIGTDTTNIVHNVKGFAFVIFKWVPAFQTMCYEIDLMCAQREGDIGNMMINGCLDHFGNNICILKSLDSAKWFYADSGRFAFKFSPTYVVPQKQGQLNLMWYVPPTHHLYQYYRFDYLLTKHYYTYDAISRNPAKRDKYVKWFVRINKKILKKANLFDEYYSRKGIPNHIAKRIKTHT